MTKKVLGLLILAAVILAAGVGIGSAVSDSGEPGSASMSTADARIDELEESRRELELRLEEARQETARSDLQRSELARELTELAKENEELRTHDEQEESPGVDWSAFKRAFAEHRGILAKLGSIEEKSLTPED